VGNDGPYDIYIGENPTGSGEIALWVLGTSIIKATAIEERYPNEPATDEDTDVVLPENSWRKIRNKHEVTKDEIEEAVENAGRVYKNSDGLYMWVVTIGGVTIIVRGYHVQNKGVIEIGTAYRTTQQEVGRLVDRFEFRQIYPNR
jgi:hypothetical protein